MCQEYRKGSGMTIIRVLDFHIYVVVVCFVQFLTHTCFEGVERVGVTVCGVCFHVSFKFLRVFFFGLKRVQEGLVPVDESNKGLREQISRQEFSAEDVDRHAAERRRVKDAMLAAKEAKEKARKVRCGCSRRRVVCILVATFCFGLLAVTEYGAGYGNLVTVVFKRNRWFQR